MPRTVGRQALCLQAFLHEPHTRQMPEAAVPAFSQTLTSKPDAVAAAHARTEGGAIPVLWMSKGLGM